MTERLAANLVPGGPWAGAAVSLTGQSAVDCRWTDTDHAVIVPATDGRCDATLIRPRSGALLARRVPLSDVLLILPGEDGGNLYRLEKRCRARTEDWADQGKMSDEFYTALGRAIAKGNRWAWLSRYLAMTDALAAKLGWPTGAGARVYEWTKDRHGWTLSGDGLCHWFGCSILDPMAGLESVWRSECAP